jgi:hypothetical protein
MFFWFEGEGVNVDTSVGRYVFVVLEWLDKVEVWSSAFSDTVLAVEFELSSYNWGGGSSGAV